MINNIQITGEPDTHPEHPVYDARQLSEGRIDISSLDVTAYNVEVFDLMKEEDRAKYGKLYVELTRLAKQGKIVITTKKMETLSRSDGSTGWFKILEWANFDTSKILGA